MSLDELQRTWSSQESGSRLHVDAELLLKEVRRNERGFLATIFWRDFREVAVAIALVVFFLVRGLADDDQWTSFLLAAACMWVGGYIVVNRFRRRGRLARFGDSLVGCVEASLEQVDHQIWLLRNVLWWYLLPLGGALAVFVLDDAVEVVREGHDRGLFLAVYALFCVGLFAGIYWLNRYAVRADLEPRRQELRALRESLTGHRETTPDEAEAAE